MDHANLHRIYGNILALLTHGQFPGEAALALAEAQGLITGVVADLKAKIDEQQAGQEAGHSDRDIEDAGGLGGDGVSDRRKPRRRKKAE